MPSPRGTLDWSPAADRPDLMAPPTAVAARDIPGVTITEILFRIVAPVVGLCRETKYSTALPTWRPVTEAFSRLRLR